MLSYFLAIAIAVTSVGLYLTAFLSPKIHRQDDFLWSGLGLFYALIIWVCADRITGALLLGQLAATSMITAFIWETRQLRKAMTSQETEVTLEGISILDLILSLLGKLSNLTRKQPTVAQTPPPESQPKPTPTTEVSQKGESTETETEELIATEAISLTPNTSDSIPPTEDEDKDLLTETTILEEQKQPEISEEKIETEEHITTSVTPESSETETQEISYSSLDNQIEKEIETESESETSSAIEITPESESEKQGFFGKLLRGLRGFLGAKSSQPSIETTDQEIKDEDQLDDIQPEKSKITSPLESNLEISPEETSKEIEEDTTDSDQQRWETEEVTNDLEEIEGWETEEVTNDSDQERWESQSIVEAILDVESKEENETQADLTVEFDAESKPTIDIDKETETDRYEIVDTEENEPEKKEIAAESNFELEFSDELETPANISSDSNLDIDLELKELNIESTSLSQQEEEIDLSDDIDLSNDLGADLDDISDQIEEKEETPEKEDISLREVPEEDKINLLTDLIAEENQSSLENDLNDILGEFDLKSTTENQQSSTKKEDS
jgi:hypothetical protein